MHKADWVIRLVNPGRMSLLERTRLVDDGVRPGVPGGQPGHARA
jgi:hypothetical protein